jgi:hypothetical protein
LKYAVTHNPGQAQIMQTLLGIGESIMGAELKSGTMASAMAVLLGGGIEGGRTIGMETYLHGAGEFVRDYLAVSEWLGVSREKTLNPMLKKYLAY